MKYFTKRDKMYSTAGEQELRANTYVMRCLTVTMIVYLITFVLNLAGIFTIEAELMYKAFFSSVGIYLLVQIVSRIISLSDKRTKYFILTCTVVLFSISGMYLTYHVILVSLLPFLYATLYSSKKVMRYVYTLTVLSTVVVVYGGYFFGLCDANMVLLTTHDYTDTVKNGVMLLNKANDNPMVSLFLFFVVPRALISVAFMFVCNSIVEIVSASHKKTEEMFLQTVTALSEAVDAKDRYTSGHSKRVAEYSRRIAERMGKSKEEQDE
ncbi:MAG: hypothetical protein J6K15_06480, partial [Lachnospiraceae bacterium]|nr:hypothetical protein [Lachnospiraceae bacterium]